MCEQKHACECTWPACLARLHLAGAPLPARSASTEFALAPPRAALKPKHDYESDFPTRTNQHSHCISWHTDGRSNHVLPFSDRDAGRPLGANVVLHPELV